MIHLKKDVLTKDPPDSGFTAKRFLKKNPDYDLETKQKPCVYIGYTSKDPEERYLEHKNRIPKKKLSKYGKKVRNWNPYAAKFGERLDRKKYLFKKTFKSIDEAKRAEKNFANYYRKKGYGVWSN